MSLQGDDYPLLVLLPLIRPLFYMLISRANDLFFSADRTEIGKSFFDFNFKNIKKDEKRNNLVSRIEQGVKSPWFVGNTGGNTARGLKEKFGTVRVIGNIVSKLCARDTLGVMLSPATKPVIVHPLMNFMHYTFISGINEAGNWYYTFASSVFELGIIWCCINKAGWSF
jgi:hypothetical protein